MKLRAVLAALLLTAMAPAEAAANSADILDLIPHARAQALGGAAAGACEGADCLAANPAGLLRSGTASLSVTHAELFGDQRIDAAGFVLPLSRAGRKAVPLRAASGLRTATAVYPDFEFRSAWGIQFARRGHDPIAARGIDGGPAGSFGASDLVVQLSHARPLLARVAAGASFKWLQSELAGAKAAGPAADLALSASAGRGSPITLGLAVRNLGPGVRFVRERTPLPLNAAAGLGWRLPWGPLLAADLGWRVRERQARFMAGVEVPVGSALALRAGWLGPFGLAGGQAASPRSGAQVPAGLGMGLGFQVRGVLVDYAMTPYGVLGNAHRFTLGWRL